MRPILTINNARWTCKWVVWMMVDEEEECNHIHPHLCHAEK